MRSTDQAEASTAASPLATRLSGWLRAAQLARVTSHRALSRTMLRVGSLFGRTATATVSDSHSEDWAATFGPVVADLELLNHNTEQDFLQIGGKLAEFIEAVNLMSSELTTLVGLISGEHGLRVSQALTSALDWSREMKARDTDRVGGLDGMRQEANRLRQTLSGFHGTVAAFQTLGVLTRIEAARLGALGADFGNLADDVKLIGGTVKARVETALETAALLVSPIEMAMQNIAAIHAEQAEELPAIIAGALASLSSFREIQQRAHDLSIRLEGQLAAISLSFKKLIVSIQFHDITRQQIEHVVEALRGLGTVSGGGSPSGARDQHYIAAVVSLQSLQLADAGERFAASVAAVVGSLDDIATHVRQMADESRTLSGPEDEKTSFFLDMEQGCTAILAGLGHCADAETATSVTAQALAGTMDGMRGSIAEIRAIEIQMQRMALNAGLRAAHIGASGDALSVLANSMQHQAFESRQRTKTLVGALDAMSQASARLSGQIGRLSTDGDGSVPDATNADGRDGGVEGLRSAVTDLHSSGERSVVHIARIVDSGGSLRDDLSATRAGFTVGTLFAEAIGRARGALDVIVNTHHSAAPVDGAERGLADLAERYTMQSERDVHERLTGPLAPALVAVLPEPSAPSAPVSEELGDNIEFF
jgi:hypothetical protein